MNRDYQDEFERTSASLKKTEQKLQQSEARLTASQHIAHIGSWEVALESPESVLGLHTYWSAEKFRILGLDPEKTEPSGKNLLTVVHPDDRDLLIKKFNEAILNKRNYNFDHRIIRGNNIQRIVRERGEVIVDEKSGKPVKMIGTIQDITESRDEEEALKESEANLRTIFDNTTTVYFLVDKNLKIIAFNKGALDGLSDELGKTVEVGKDMLDFAEDNKKQMTLEMYNRVFDGAQFKIEDSYRLADGTIIWFEMHLLPVYNDKSVVHNMIVYLSDTTQRKTAEIEREKTTTDLIQRNKDLEQFSYIISHNLRLPVANILGLVNNFSVHELPRIEQKEILSAIYVSVRRLDDVVMDLNKILNTRHGESESKQQVKFSDILNDTKVGLGYLIKKENVLIESDFKRTDSLFTVKSYLSSIFHNLILNSIKFHQPALTPHITIVSEKKGNKIILTFRDNGLGIDLTKNSDGLFGLYKRFHSHENGKGMGLFMVKAQVESLGGKITVRSEVNRGTCFTIELEQ
ncbi:MAG TPA: PAS domain-containing protein [Bacteroidia bacterium]|nr:PAS domain-containing protein [Bacteroidia bacterium]